ncbi:MAG: hypothetical protein IKQ46_10615 [Bacteroidales bacterium]|nr:hypothetical protein [Bacteroidales bacterium]
MAVSTFSASEVVSRENVNSRISGVNQDIAGVSQNIVSINSNITGINRSISSINSSISSINNNISSLQTKINNARAGTSLYNNGSGSNGSITLSQSVANFSYIEIYTDSGRCHKFLSPNNTSKKISYVNNDGNAITWISKTISFSGKSISVTKHVSGFATNQQTIVYTDKSSPIYKVIGYKNNI